MKCFECGTLCHTQYHYGPSHGEINPRVKAVSKLCPHCGWESFRTKVPEPLT